MPSRPENRAKESRGLGSARGLLILIAALAIMLLLVFFLGQGDAPLVPDRTAEERQPEASASKAASASTEKRIERVTTDELMAELHAELIALASTDPQAFRERIDAIFAPPVEDYQALAALQAWQHSQVDALPLLAEKLTDPNSSPSLRASSLQLLETYCQFDGRARQAMLEYLATNPTDPGQRSSAFANVLRWCDAQEIDTCMPLLQAESDPDVVLAAARALDSSQTPAARANLESLHWRHPDPKVRIKLRSLRIGK